VGEASCFKQTRSKSSDPAALTYNTNGKEIEERNKVKKQIIKEGIKDKQVK
jgi:hypothetical protein